MPVIGSREITKKRLKQLASQWRRPLPDLANMTEPQMENWMRENDPKNRPPATASQVAGLTGGTFTDRQLEKLEGQKAPETSPLMRRQDDWLQQRESQWDEIQRLIRQHDLRSGPGPGGLPDRSEFLSLPASVANTILGKVRSAALRSGPKSAWEGAAKDISRGFQGKSAWVKACKKVRGD